MAIRMIVSDLDGTLLDAAYRLSAANRQALREAAAQGVQVLLATGRMFRSAVRYAEEIGLNSPIISYNGGMVQAPDGTLLEASFLPPPVVAQVLGYVFQQGWHVQLYADDALFYAAPTTASRSYEQATRIQGMAVGQAGLLARTARVPKLLVVVADPSQTAAAMADLRQAFPDDIVVMQSNPTYIEIVRPGVSKAAAMLEVARQRGIAAAEIMALGDSGNDISMLRAAGLGVAMGNAAAAVRQAADAVTGTVAEDGAAMAVRRYVLDAGR